MSTDPLHGAVRGVRAGVLTVPAVGGAVGAHALSGGCPPAFAVLLSLGLCWPFAVALLGARRRVPALVAGLLAAQAVTHVVLTQACPDPSAPGLVGHVSWSMLAAHAVASALLAVVLGRADAGLWTAHALLRAVRRFLAPVLVVVLPPVHPARSVDSSVALPRTLWQAAPPRRRGPPVACAS